MTLKFFFKLLLVSFLSGHIDINAQIDPSPVIAGVESDISYLGEAYLGPLSQGIQVTLAQSITSTPRLKLGSFRLGLQACLVSIPESWRFFEIDAQRLQALELADPSERTSPTAFGPDQRGVRLAYRDPRLLGLAGTSFTMPAGYGIAIMPNANLDLAVGIGLNSEISLRWLPELSPPLLIGSRFRSWGLGIKHHLGPSISWLDRNELNFILATNHSQFFYTQALGEEDGSNQNLNVSNRQWSFAVALVKSCGPLQAYASGRMAIGRSKTDLLGEYDYVDPLQPLSPNQVITDPLSFKQNHSLLLGGIGFNWRFYKIAFLQLDLNFAQSLAVNFATGLQIDI